MLYLYVHRQCVRQTNKRKGNKREVNRQRDKTAGRILTCQDDHVHPPEDAHDPPNHDDSCQYLDEGGCHVEPEHTTNSSL